MGCQWRMECSERGDGPKRFMTKAFLRTRKFLVGRVNKR
jgi:hypothetical protein